MAVSERPDPVSAVLFEFGPRADEETKERMQFWSCGRLAGCTGSCLIGRPTADPTFDPSGFIAMKGLSRIETFARGNSASVLCSVQSLRTLGHPALLIGL